ncbi:ATP-binding protein, partial [Candidatus Latescibacterota bacterium]
MPYEISLQKIIENRDKELSGRLLKIKKTAKTLLSYTHGKFPYYTPHDFSHSDNVEENLNWLIPDEIKEKMDNCEIFFLIIASWLHDWGMIGDENENPEKIRDEHHIRTEINFEKMYDKIYLSEQEARVVGRICRGHRKEDLYSEKYEDIVFGSNNKIRIRFLSALLRIADECDVTHNRTPEIIYYSLNPKGNSELEFKRHLSITGIGQLKEKHKINLSAIARDPKGARTLRDLAEKIQNELDVVKGILAQNEIVLDVVELNLETRGFIDKPIGFDVNKQKIVDLLIGEHLYSSKDVAIRELLQNSIDSCKLREQNEPSFQCSISIERLNDNIIIEDNGLGMNFYEAKKFLSIVGSSYYNSEELIQHLKGKLFDPISQYGIGILSSFLISKGITIETMKEGQEPCKFSIKSLDEEWKFEKGTLHEPGTTITLDLNEEGKKINIESSLNRYFLSPEITVYYQDKNKKLKKFKSNWSTDLINERFSIDILSKDRFFIIATQTVYI